MDVSVIDGISSIFVHPKDLVREYLEQRHQTAGQYNDDGLICWDDLVMYEGALFGLANVDPDSSSKAV